MERLFSPSTSETESPVAEVIRERIRHRGKISFAEFMELALYHPDGGYYASQPVFGAAGDYYTSPAAHPAFGALLAVQLARMWEILERPATFYAVEMGAGNGILARDILDFAPRLSDGFSRALRYLSLDRFAPGGPTVSAASVQRIISDRLPFRNVVGCILSNELLDSFPVHRFQVYRGELKEIYVTLSDSGGFVEALGAPSTPLISQRLARLGFVLPEGFRGEVNLGIASWTRQVSDALKRGFVLTIDYGYEASALYSPRRSQGTLQTYYRHTDGASPYQRVGRQDMTAHVDFSLVISEGEASGLNTLGLLTQSDFLKSLGFDTLLDRVRKSSLEAQQKAANLAGMRELVKPDGLGGFKALIQERDTGVQDISELAPDPSLVGKLDPPPLSQDHMPLMQGAYPEMAWQPPPELWPFDRDAT
ncbi:MAG: SAM-dependent methyltransferase [Chloroflexi bacterium]|nr:SAM-dependent methyltransferase [Chloroflexota bacterium]